MRRLLPLAAALAVAFAGASNPASGNLRSCATRAYSYAGYAAAHRASGVSASVTVLSSPQVLDGHVAAWVGVGGPGDGPSGADEWLQVGLSSFADDGGNLYYELALPNRAPQYVQVRAGVAPGESHRLTVVELPNRPSWWLVRIDSQAVSQRIYLPGSHGRWAPIATAESWNAGAAVCNTFAFRFGRVVAAGTPDGDWRTFARGACRTRAIESSATRAAPSALSGTSQDTLGPRVRAVHTEGASGRRLRAGRSARAQPQLHRHRAHPARPAA